MMAGLLSRSLATFSTMREVLWETRLFPTTRGRFMGGSLLFSGPRMRTTPPKEET
jgi:hypothetical protein